MAIDKDLIDRLRARGEEMLTQVSAELMQNPRFMKAMEGALKGKERVEDAAAQAIRKMNIPTQTDHRKALRRIESLEEQLADLKKQVKAQSGPAKGAKKARKTGTRKKVSRSSGKSARKAG